MKRSRGQAVHEQVKRSMHEEVGGDQEIKRLNSQEATEEVKRSRIQRIEMVLMVALWLRL